MILVLVTYKVDAETIGRLRDAHIHWLRQGLADGRLLGAGRQNPPVGGMLMVRGTIESVREWCATDPFATADAADYQLIEVDVTMAAPGLGGLLA